MPNDVPTPTQYITEKAYAKINIGLEVLRKREDGYHDINSLFTRVSLHDTIVVSNSDFMECVTIPSLGIPQEENLAYKAGMALKNTFGINQNAKITIHKHIPNGAGLGGGSSDCASVLKALCKLWQIDLDSPQTIIQLHEIASKLGSDVPFFLGKGSAIAESRGESLYYFPIEIPYKVVLVFPDIHISTPWAYKQLNVHTEGKRGRAFRDILLMGLLNPIHLRDYCVNDFERVVFEEHPTIKGIKEQLYQVSADFALMSGSGSTVFGFFKDEEKALNACLHFPSMRTYLCDVLGNE
jgi:4-diphosphocytidyl-2-C-methyl-D-erythritol kinase